MIPPASPGTLSAMGGRSGGFGRSLRQLRDARAAWTMIRLLLAAQAVPFIWDLAAPGAGKMGLAQQTYGLSLEAFVSGAIWQPLTYALIHANWFHLLANLACILLLGPKLEHIISKRTFWVVALFSVIAGGALFLFFTPPASGQPQILVGSSAICFGFLILLTTLSPDSRFLPLFISGRSIGIAIILANLSLTLLNPDLPTGILSQWGAELVERGLHGLFEVSHACHLGGSLAGFLCGRYLLRPRVSIASLKRAREKRESAAALRE